MLINALVPHLACRHSHYFLTAYQLRWSPIDVQYNKAVLRLHACSYCCSSVVLHAMGENVLSSRVWSGCEVVSCPDPHPLTSKRVWWLLSALLVVPSQQFWLNRWWLYFHDVALFHWIVQYQDCWLSTIKKVLSGHQTLFLVRGWGLGTRLDVRSPLSYSHTRIRQGAFLFFHKHIHA